MYVCMYVCMYMHMCVCSWGGGGLTFLKGVEKKREEKLANRYANELYILSSIVISPFLKTVFGVSAPLGAALLSLLLRLSVHIYLIRFTIRAPSFPQMSNLSSYATWSMTR